MFITEKDPSLRTKNGRTVIEQLQDLKWKFQFSCLVDRTKHLNDLSLRLQGKSKFVNDMWNQVQGFRAKLALFEQQAAKNDLRHFPTVAELLPYEPGIGKLRDIIATLMESFDSRFQDLRNF